METFDIYKDIAERTNGDIYIGVVGPVRTGKSTFIKRFMDLLILPNISDEHARSRAKDELPQSAAGKTIMTTEPKFVPNEAVEISLDDYLSFKVRMIDSVGYLIPNVSGHLDGDSPRMVSTPWSDNKMPFKDAAELGTKKVITEHSTIGIAITTDGSITDLPRENYVEAEERIVSELKAINKPFVILLNTTKPFTGEVENLRIDLTNKYNVPVVPVNCAQLKIEDINSIMEKVLYEFPIKEIKINYPKWIETLHNDHWLKSEIIKTVRDSLEDVNKLRELKKTPILFEKNEYVKKSYIDKNSLGEGSTTIEINVEDKLFYNVLSETTGMEIDGEYQLISTIKILADSKKEYDKVKYALQEVKRKGYGIVTPAIDEMKLEEPVLVKHGSKYGVRIKATAPSIHLIRADIETEISPIVGTEQQSEDLVNYFKSEMNKEPNDVWELNMFGKTMHELVKDGLQNKLYHIPEDAQMKFQESLQKIINEGSGGLICILL